MLGPIWISLLITVAEAPTPAPAPVATGQVTATTGRVFLDRGGRRYQASVRSALRPGDRVETADGSGAGLFLFDGHAIYLGPATSVAIGATTQGGLIRLDRGEIRATVAGRGGMAVVSPSARARTERGILHVATSAGGTRFWVERGASEVHVAGRAPTRIAEGQESFIAAADRSRRTADATDAARTVEPVSRVEPDGRTLVSAATGAGWTVEPDALRLAGAAADSRRLRDGHVSQANDDSASSFQASGQMGPATGATGTSPTTPGGRSPTTTEGTLPSTTGEEGTLPASTGEEGTIPNTTGDDSASQPIAFAQANSAFSAASSSIAFSGASGAFSSAFSSGQPGDAQQDSFNPAFPGNIHLITTVNQYNLNGVHLSAKDALFPSQLSYYSIGVGTPPTKPVTTSFLTGTSGTPITIPIPHFNAYLINLNQYAIPDPALATLNTKAVTGISGLIGANPTAPVIQNATPLTDPRAVFNNRATFALGEFALNRTGKNHNIPVIDLRRSDQDRQIIPISATKDQVTPNPDVSFVAQPDAKFFPAFKQVYVPVPGTFHFAPNVNNLDLVRKAALTTLLASTLLEYSHQTGQTQFAIGGKVYDITGYHLPPAYAAAVAPDLHATRKAASTSTASPAHDGLKLAAANGPAGRGGLRSGGPSLRSLGSSPEATRSGTSTGAGHAPGPRHHH